MLYKIAKVWLTLVLCIGAIVGLWVVISLVSAAPVFALSAVLLFLTISAAMIVAEGPNV